MNYANTIYGLSKILNHARDFCGFSNRLNIRPFAEKENIDLEQLMREIEYIVNNHDYFVGGHMECTRINVIPAYLRTGEIIEDKDHIEGLMKILLVHSGKIRDY